MTDLSIYQYIITENFIKIIALFALLMFPIKMFMYFIFDKHNKN